MGRPEYAGVAWANQPEVVRAVLPVLSHWRALALLLEFPSSHSRVKAACAAALPPHIWGMLRVLEGSGQSNCKSTAADICR